MPQPTTDFAILIAYPNYKFHYKWIWLATKRIYIHLLKPYPYISSPNCQTDSSNSSEVAYTPWDKLNYCIAQNHHQPPRQGAP